MVVGLFTTSLLSLLLPITALAGPHASGPILGRHHEIARRAEGNVELYKRGAGSRWSFYNVETGNAGSCGTFHNNGDFTVAMNAAQMNSGWCYKTITMTYNGRTTTASITDTCPGCPWNGLDLTEGLFQFFAPSSVGIIYVWSPSSTHSSHTPSSTKSSVPPTSTHTSSALPSTSSASTTSSPLSINYSSGPASGLAEPTGVISVTPGTANNLDTLNQAFIGIGGLMLVAHGG
ncbi:hypothetical protein BYT27DRAFT_7222192 [Phlegmacium glaucopus]|nr:hypothetical protein BYT27DRAFT_7222192 [Phlegmacium glaucopus]